jgi:DNA-binding response OmpR family regulator
VTPRTLRARLVAVALGSILVALALFGLAASAITAQELGSSLDRALEQVWDDAAVPNVVDRYVARLRRKLGEPPLIHTVRGVGFMLRS